MCEWFFLRVEVATMSNICRSLHGAHDTSFAPIPFTQTCPVEAPEDVERDVSGLLKQLGATRRNIISGITRFWGCSGILTRRCWMPRHRPRHPSQSISNVIYDTFWLNEVWGFNQDFGACVWICSGVQCLAWPSQAVASVHCYEWGRLPRFG